MSTVLSHPFRFALDTIINLSSDDESKWTFAVKEPPIPLNGPESLKNRFVYAFSLPADGNPPRLQMEYRADANGNLSTCLGTVRESFNHDAKEAALIPTGTDVTSLPESIQGMGQHYFFIVTQARLSSDALNFLTTKRPKALPVIDLSNPKHFMEITPGERHLGVSDPLAIGRQLCLHYERACNDIINYTTEHDGQSSEVKSAIRQRHQTLLLARMLVSVLDADPEDKHDLKDEFADESGASARSFVSSYDSRVKQMIRLRDNRGHLLCKFLRSELIEIYEEAYRADEPNCYPAFLSGMGAACRRLAECPNGKARLGAWVDSPPHWVKTYLLPDGGLSETHFQVARKSAAAITSLWTEFFPALAVRKPKKVTEITLFIERVTRQSLLTVATRQGVVTVRTSSSRTTIRATFQTFTFLPDATAVQKVAAWIGGSADAAGPVLKQMAEGFEVLNLLLASQSFINANPDDKLVKGINLLGSCLDTIKEFGVMLKLGSKTLRVVGGVSAVIDAGLAAKDGVDAYSRNDTGALVGATAVSLGSVLALMGATCAITGLGAGATVVGVPLALVLEAAGAVLVAAGWIVTLLASDSDLETFVAHCRFGTDHGSGSATPPWSSSALAAWANGEEGLKHQVRSLFSLLAAFTLDSADYTSVRIYPGMLTEGSVFRVAFDASYNLSIRHRPVLLIDIDSKTMSLESGDPADLSKLSIRNDASGRLEISVTAEWPPGQQPPNAIQHQHCAVAVTLRLGGKPPQPIPISGKQVSYVIHTLGTGLTLSNASSKEF